MENNIKSIRPFVGAKDYKLSCNFYEDFGFEKLIISNTLSYFKLGDFGFYLQDYYAKEWIDNTMIFLEVENLNDFLKVIKDKRLEQNYTTIRLSEIVYNDWGNEFFLHDPSGVLWHIGEFK